MDIIKSIEENFFAVGRYWGSLNSSINHEQSIWYMSTGIPAADLNWVWNEKAFVTIEAGRISRIKEYYEQQALPFWWWVYPRGQSQSVDETLNAHGFHFVQSIPCLAASLSTLTLKACCRTDIAISLVKTRKDLDLWERISFSGFEMEGFAKKQYRRFVVSFEISNGSQQKLFLAYCDGNPAGTALSFFHNDTAGIYFVSTVPDYRKRGVGLAMTLTIMGYARQAGFNYCVLQSSEAGLNVYKRAGFKEYCQTDIYRPATC
jgi:ribosomal protein S18 acetylase RimI-like enzyme